MTARGAEGICFRALVAFPDGADVEETMVWYEWIRRPDKA